ncbi:MAG: nuclear transport factor 2 family protein [Pseudomonadota bacterium]
MNPTRPLLAVFLAVCAATVFAQTPELPQSRKELVKRFVAAFNAQDAKAMGEMVTEDVEWLNVSGKVVGSDATGRAELTSSMVKYFASCRSCRSELTQVIESKERVVTVEVASWQGAKGPRSQQGIAVYEFSGPLIRRVYYYPAEK